MSTLELYEQTKNKLYAWIEEVFENRLKIIGDINWSPHIDPHIDYFNISENSEHLIESINLVKNAEDILKELKLRILRIYAERPDVCKIYVNKLTPGQKSVLKAESEERVKSLKEEILPHEELLSQF